MFNGANKEDIVKILANAEALSNHLDRNSLDMDIDKRNVTRDMDQRFAEILKKAELENNSYANAPLQGQGCIMKGDEQDPERSHYDCLDDRELYNSSWPYYQLRYNFF